MDTPWSAVLEILNRHNNAKKRFRSFKLDILGIENLN